jgi:zinc D-Ala-D-Ala dipeptidase
MIFNEALEGIETVEPYEITILEAFNKPVPNMDSARVNKIGYPDIPIDTSHPLYDEPLVNLDEYAKIGGQSYYSRSNSNSGDALSWVNPNVYVRQSVAEKLCALNQLLGLPIITKFFSGEVEIFIQDGLRPLSLQKLLYDKFYPRLIREQHPGINNYDFIKRLNSLASKPSTDPLRPSPHATGGCFDVTLRYIQESSFFVDDSHIIEFGHLSGDVRESVYLDYYENHAPVNSKQELGKRNRRAFYAIMTGLAFDMPTGFINNPDEWWHWGCGDQLSAKVSGQPKAYYSFTELTRI